MLRILKKLLRKLRRPKTRIPKHIRVKRKSIHLHEKNAAKKVTYFAKRHTLELYDVQEIYDVEVVYEKAKYSILKDYPSDLKLRKKMIATEKKQKYANLKDKVDYKVYSTYRTHRQNRKKRS